MLGWVVPVREELALVTYRFDSSWHLPGSVDTAWDAILRVEDWPSWWPAVAATEILEPGRPDGVGLLVRYVVRSPLGYRLTVLTRTTEVERPHLIAVAVVGELEGRGRWTLTPQGTGVRVHQLWEVSTTRRWMRLLAPVALPVFRWSHDRAARRGEAGLARRLATRQ